MLIQLQICSLLMNEQLQYGSLIVRQKTSFEFFVF